MERSVVHAAMNEVFNQIRASLADTHPYRAEPEMYEIALVLGWIHREVKKWEGKSPVPPYEKGAILEAMFVDDPMDIASALDEYLGGLRQIEGPVDRKLLK